MPPLVDAARRFEARLDKVHGAADVVAYGRVQLAGAVQAIAIHERDPVPLRRALDMYESTAMMSSRRGRVATAVGLDAAHLAELLGDSAGARRWIQRARTALVRIEWSTTTPLEARLSVGRQRYELAGSAAALANDPVELAWILHSTVHPFGPIDRTASATRLASSPTTAPSYTSHKAGGAAGRRW